MTRYRRCFDYWYKQEGGRVVAHGPTKKSLTCGGTSKIKKGVYIKSNIVVFQHEAVLEPMKSWPNHHTMSGLLHAVSDYWIEQLREA